jgi:DNA-binding response OmpR family regulator
VSIARARILIVEDDDGVRHALERGLTRAGFTTIGAASRAEALRSDDHDIALVDLGLPDSDGAEICKELRSRLPGRPIIVVTGRQDELDVVDSLDSGADDYVTKPFSLAVLTARIRRHLDRSSGTIVVGELMIDRRARTVTSAGGSIDLAPREFDLLATLAERSGTTVSKDQLIAAVWDTHWARSTHTLAVHVSALRSKLQSGHGDPPTIAAVAGDGYRLDAVPSNR